MKKVLLVTNIPTPYRIPLFNEVDSLLRKRGASLFVAFAASTYSRRQWPIDLTECRFQFRILPSARKLSLDRERVMFTHPGLLRLVRDLAPAVIVTSGFSLATTKLYLFSWIRRLPPLVLWSGAIKTEGRLLCSLRRMQRRLLCRRISHFLAYGSLAARYLESLGVSGDEITISFNTVDTTFFIEEVQKEKTALSPSGALKNLLFVGYLSPKKQVDLLLRIAVRLVELNRDFCLRLVGDGTDAPRLKLLAERWGVADRVEFLGFRQKKELPRILAQADLFLFPTLFDVWGLVLVEAMAAGLPCLVSHHAGAAFDLIEEGRNGHVVDFNRTDEVASLIGALLDQPKKMAQMGKCAADTIREKLSLGASAAAMAGAITPLITRRRLT